MAARKPPYSKEAEASAVGSMLLSRQAVDACVNGLDSADFYDPNLRRIFDAIGALHSAGAAIDPQTVSAELDKRGQLEQVGGPQAVLKVQAATPASANHVQYALTVAELATCRRALEIAVAVEDAAYDQKLDEVERLLAVAEDRLAPPLAAVEPGHDLSTLLTADTSYDWLLTGCLERGERLIITGAEGGGKSTLLRQMAVQLACGVHPFLPHDPHPRRKVLHVDFENSPLQSEREYQRIARPQVRELYEPGWLHVKYRPQGIDLTQRADVRWLEALIVHHEPEIVFIGPLYKMLRDRTEGRQSVHSEESAREVAWAIDELRVRYGLCIVIEAHSAKGDGRGGVRGLEPIGSSLWLRWPEFGFGLGPRKQGAKIVDWRGPRDRNRTWPRALVWGQSWPWLPASGMDAEEKF